MAKNNGKQEAEYPIPISLPPMPHCLVIDIGMGYAASFSLVFHNLPSLYLGEMMFTLVSPIFGHSVAQSLGASPRKKW